MPNDNAQEWLHKIKVSIKVQALEAAGYLLPPLFVVGDVTKNDCGGSQPPVLAAVERGRVKCQKAALRALYWSELSEWTCSIPTPVPLPPPGFDALSVDEKIDYLQSLWDRVAATPEAIPVPDWHRDILDERLKDLEANPAAGDSWDVVQERLRKKLDTSY